MASKDPRARLRDVSAGPAAAVDPNYQYWRERGGTWSAEYAQRKKRDVSLHIQELMLTDYVLRHAAAGPSPFRVLEFGCGVGRHLRNLVQVPGAEVFGYDQSAAMASGCLEWTGPEWFEGHVTVGAPTGRLPYGDAEFDLVYTAEVLVHVRPEHLDGVLNELLRVCRGQVLHLETSEHMPVAAEEHDGCWRHDLVGAYARLGRVAELLPSGYRIHAPYRVVIGEAPRFTWAPAILGLLRRLDVDIDEGYSGIAREAADLRYGLTVRDAEIARLAGVVAGLQTEVEAARAELVSERRIHVAQRLEAERTSDALGRRVSELEWQRDEFLGRVWRHLIR
jgi:SAM-dependent methyltransferase